MSEAIGWVCIALAALMGGARWYTFIGNQNKNANLQHRLWASILTSSEPPAHRLSSDVLPKTIPFRRR